MCGILYAITQTYGVTVAQVILVHFVEVRILVGLPFFLPHRGFVTETHIDFSLEISGS